MAPLFIYIEAGEIDPIGQRTFATRLYQKTAGKVTSSRQCIGWRNALCKKADDHGIDRRIGQAVELA